MGKYEYIGKGKSCAGWMLLAILWNPAKCADTRNLKAWNGWNLQNQITAQRGGDWLQITQKPERITQTYSRYDGKSYLDKW